MGNEGQMDKEIKIGFRLDILNIIIESSYLIQERFLFTNDSDELNKEYIKRICDSLTQDLVKILEKKYTKCEKCKCVNSHSPDCLFK